MFSTEILGFLFKILSISKIGDNYIPYVLLTIYVTIKKTMPPLWNNIVTYFGNT